MEEESSSESQPGRRLIPGYDPFIGDVPISSAAEPFPLPQVDKRSPQKIEKIRHKLAPIIMNKTFSPPVKLSDFCLIAAERWDREKHPEDYPTPVASSDGGCANNCNVI